MMASKVVTVLGVFLLATSGCLAYNCLKLDDGEKIISECINKTSSNIDQLVCAFENLQFMVDGKFIEYEPESALEALGSDVAKRLLETYNKCRETANEMETAVDTFNAFRSCFGEIEFSAAYDSDISSLIRYKFCEPEKFM